MPCALFTVHVFLSGMVRRLAAKCHLASGRRRHPPPDQTALCVHPDRSLGSGNPGLPWARRGPLPQKPESTVKRGNGAEKQPEPPPPEKIHRGRIRRPLMDTRLFSPTLSLLHILNLSIYLYSHLFTFSFKISVYKRVYKLKDNFLLVLSL